MMFGFEFLISILVFRILFLMFWKLRDINFKVFCFCVFGGVGFLIGDDVVYGFFIEEYGLYGVFGLVVERLLYELFFIEMEL